MSSNPRAQVPGYCGFIPGKNAQNKFGASFGHITKGAYQTNKDAFLTTNISNNQFIKQQYPETDGFWSNKNKINAFEEVQKKNQDLGKTGTRAIHVQYKPEQVTTLTYDEAIRKAI